MHYATYFTRIPSSRRHVRVENEELLDSFDEIVAAHVTRILVFFENFSVSFLKQICILHRFSVELPVFHVKFAMAFTRNCMKLEIDSRPKR